MSPRRSFHALLFALTLVAVSALAPHEPPAPPAPKEEVRADFRALIDRLVDVTEGDVGYSPSVVGTTFTPLDAEGKVSAVLLFQQPLKRSDTLRRLVEEGAAAVPLLLAHLDDKRRTSMTIRHEGSFGGMFPVESLDFNERTDRTPRRVGKRGPTDFDLATWLRIHTLTVGDLCFVALGQIVNRNYQAVHYQPTAIILVSSPTNSARLREQVERAWKGTNREKHRASLVADFLTPDNEGRRIGACKRLAYYYPHILEPLALAILSQPTFGDEVHYFVRTELYREPNPSRRKALFEEFIARHREAARDGILGQLFDDLKTLETYEQNDTLPHRSEFWDQPRRLLIQLYGRPKDVKSDQRPYISTLSRTELMNLIHEGLIYDKSEKIDLAVRDILLRCKDDDGLALACIERLVGRGYDVEIEAYCRRRMNGEPSEAARLRLEEALAKVGWTPLHVAVKRDDLKTIVRLLNGGAEAGPPARDGTTPLHLAAALGREEYARLLVEAGAPPDAKDKDGLTPVQFAARRGWFDAVRFLTDRGCAVPDALVAVVADRADRIIELVDWGGRVARMTADTGETPLHLAAAFNRIRIAKILVAREAPVDAKNEENETALHLAIRFGATDIARLLIQSGADAQATDAYGMLPLHGAAQEGQVPVVQALLDAKTDPDATISESGLTALHLAASQGHRAVVELLLQRGAAANAADRQGLTPLHLAARSQRLSSVEALIASKAKIDARDETGSTPLHLAAGEGNARVVNRLLAAGADATARNDSGCTPGECAERWLLEELLSGRWLERAARWFSRDGR